MFGFITRGQFSDLKSVDLKLNGENIRPLQRNSCLTRKQREEKKNKLHFSFKVFFDHLNQRLSPTAGGLISASTRSLFLLVNNPEGHPEVHRDPDTHIYFGSPR